MGGPFNPESQPPRSARAIVLLVLSMAFLVTSCGGGGEATGGGGNVPSDGDNPASLTWTAPTAYADGSTLDPAEKIQSYNVRYGTAPRMYTGIKSVLNPGTTTVSTSINLSAGTWYFCVSCVDVDRNESDFSNEMSKTIP